MVSDNSGMLGPFRLFLAVLVVLSHTAGYPHGEWTDPGLIAVQAFFVISGFLMPAAFEGNYKGQFADQTRRYVLNRLLRIFPMYWLALAIAIYLNARIGGWEFQYAIEHPQVFVQNFLLLGMNQADFWGRDVRFIGPAWTLDVELQYYLAVPILVWLWRKRPTAVTALLVLWSIAAVWLRSTSTTPLVMNGTLFPWMPEFAAGFLLYVYRLPIPARPGLLSGAIGDLSYPLYLAHRPLLELSLAEKFLSDHGYSVGLWSVFGVNVIIATAGALVLHFTIAPWVERLRIRYRTHRPSPER